MKKLIIILFTFSTLQSIGQKDNDSIINFNSVVGEWKICQQDNRPFYFKSDELSNDTLIFKKNNIDCEKVKRQTSYYDFRPDSILSYDFSPYDSIFMTGSLGTVTTTKKVIDDKGAHTEFIYYYWRVDSFNHLLKIIFDGKIEDIYKILYIDNNKLILTKKI